MTKLLNVKQKDQGTVKINGVSSSFVVFRNLVFNYAQIFKTQLLSEQCCSVWFEFRCVSERRGRGRERISVGGVAMGSSKEEKI